MFKKTILSKKEIRGIKQEGIEAGRETNKRLKEWTEQADWKTEIN